MILPGRPYSFTPSTGGKYRIKDNALEFAQKSYSQAAALKSGDVITITASGYKTLTFKVSIKDDKLTVSSESTPGDDHAAPRSPCRQF